MRITLLFLLVNIYAHAQLEPIEVANLNFKLSALSEQIYNYGFAKGDKVYINYREERGKKLKSFELYTQNGNKIMTEFNLESLDNESITINNTGIYTFRFENTSLGRRIINFSITREPVSVETKDFNTEVKKRTIIDTTYITRAETYLKSEQFKVVEITSDQDFFINSGSNATLMGGKSRVMVPVNLPPNTVKWYYQVAASRDESQIENIKSQLSLVADLSKLIDKSGTASFAIELLSLPPGADFCDVYLLNRENYSKFKNKEEFQYYITGTRENIKSANVEIEGGFNMPMYLGLKNPDNLYGVNVVINIAAIVLEQELATREIKEPKIRRRIELYLENE
ncbi:MAG: hypothetical protein ACSHWW_08785 [Nonlabens sp.]|uniref:hypothetical protein n=1 Tax=Nonlabens sp. TaxID=1888209 RepID=UPI003EF0FAFB